METLCSAAGYIFFFTKSLNNLISTKKRVFKLVVGPSETEKSQLLYSWLKNGTFNEIWQIFLDQHSQPLYNAMQKAIENLVLVHGVNFDFLFSFINNGTNYLLTFDNSCEETCN